MPAGIILKTGQSFDVDEDFDSIQRYIEHAAGKPTPIVLHVRDASGPDRRCAVYPDQVAAVFARAPRV